MLGFILGSWFREERVFCFRREMGFCISVRSVVLELIMGSFLERERAR